MNRGVSYVNSYDKINKKICIIKSRLRWAFAQLSPWEQQALSGALRLFFSFTTYCTVGFMWPLWLIFPSSHAPAYLNSTTVMEANTWFVLWLFMLLIPVKKIKLLACKHWCSTENVVLFSSVMTSLMTDACPRIASAIVPVAAMCIPFICLKSEVGPVGSSTLCIFKIA